jgi:hypothetical protein
MLIGRIRMTSRTLVSPTRMIPINSVRFLIRTVSCLDCWVCFGGEWARGVVGKR